MSSKPQGTFRRTLRSGAVITAAVAVLGAGADAAFSIAAPAAAANAAATADASTLTQTTSGAVQQGAPVTFAYSVPAGSVNAKNWIGIYKPTDTPGTQGSTSWQYVTAAAGTATFDTHALAAGDWKVYLFYNDGYTVLAGPITLTVTPAAPPVVVPPQPDTGTGPNLIVNGGAEQGEGTLDGVDTNTVPGWKVDGLLNSVAYGATGGEGVADFAKLTTPGPVDRGQNFFAGGGGGVSTGTQTADVKAAAKQIDTGKVTYNLTAWLGGSGTVADTAGVVSTFLDAHGKTLGTATLAPVTPAMRNNTTSLIPEQSLGKIPAGTRSVRTVLTVTGNQPTDRTGHGLGFADDLSLRISAPITAPAAPKPPTVKVPGYDHVFVVMMENQDYKGIVGNTAQAPYLNSLLPKGANLTDALGETHPSDPNYVALAGGSLFGVTDNTPFTSTVNAQHVGDLVDNAGGSWRGYMENAAQPCDTTAHGAYTIDDLPFYFFNDIKNNPVNCAAHLLPLTQMTTDLKSTATTPTFAWLSADDCDDMEGCGVKAGDTWLANTLPALFNSPAWKTQRSLLIVTWDEDAADGQKNLQNIPTLVLGSQGTVKAGSTDGDRYTHYSVLRTIEAALDLPSLTKNDLYAPAIEGIWNCQDHDDQ
jgi:hypothetical protein